MVSLRISKDELPISHGICFHIPIHSKLLDSAASIPKDIAQRVFPQAAQEWYNDLKNHATSLDMQDKNRKWYEEVFLKKPIIISKAGVQRISHLGWHDNIQFMENGFVDLFSISRNSGGTLYFKSSENECKKLVLYGNDRYVRFKNDKLGQFKIPDEKAYSEGVKTWGYTTHNVDIYPGALFLRNWAIIYMNEAFKALNL